MFTSPHYPYPILILGSGPGLPDTMTPGHHDPPLEEEPGGEAVHWNGEESLRLWAVDVHGYDLSDSTR